LTVARAAIANGGIVKAANRAASTDAIMAAFVAKARKITFFKARCFDEAWPDPCRRARHELQVAICAVGVAPTFFSSLHDAFALYCSIKEPPDKLWGEVHKRDTCLRDNH
jgi:hypothetical protein